jgi:hypothetical protein
MQYFDMMTEDIVDEEYVRAEYEWFKKQPWFSGDYEAFKDSHFQPLGASPDEFLGQEE